MQKKDLKKGNAKMLKNKSIVITGASRGLGKELALQLSKQRCRLALAARSIGKLKDLENRLIKSGMQKEEVLIIKADVSKKSGIEKIYSSAISKFGKIDIFINNAGVNIQKKFYEFTEQEYYKLMDTNFKSVFISAKLAYLNKVKTFVVISSVAGWMSSKYYSLYSATKHALEGFVKGAKKESSQKFIVFHPYRLKTSFHKNYKIKTSHFRLDPGLYAKYIVAVLNGDKKKAFFCFARNWALWSLNLFIEFINKKFNKKNRQ